MAPPPDAMAVDEGAPQVGDKRKADEVGPCTR
jgi:hypothetical protein